MSSQGHSTGLDDETLRRRLSQKGTDFSNGNPQDTAQDVVRRLNKEQGQTQADKHELKTYGRTPDGTVFVVPHTEDMVSQLFDPSQPKNTSDFIIVGILFSMVGLFWVLPQFLRPTVFGCIFLFWRLGYNAGIGWLLWNQSNHNRLTSWAKKTGIFENPATGKNQYPALYKFLAHEMEAKIPKDYSFATAPLEYNTWLLFRRVVDLILMSDFTSYCLFAIACGGRPVNESWFITASRWIGGWLLVLFNLWVKLDAHRVVKDFAWYWGDFFYLIDQELNFDGVFELAPHPMYSVGYAGFYGISMMAASYKVLFISIVAHAAQMTFLHFVETPHIEKTYNAPAPIKKREHQSPEATILSETQSTTSPNQESFPLERVTSHDVIASSEALPTIQTIDLHRVTDVTVIILNVYLCSSALLTPSTWPWQTMFVMNALAWRLWYSLGIGYILDRQSNKKTWTRHFVKYGESSQEAWRQWKGIYHLSMTMCYSSFACATWKMYGLPEDWTIGMATLRHVIGFACILLHIWTVSSIHESLGDFGWYFGDFFFDTQTKLNYSGIYRFLNNPERTIGLAGLWGAAILTWSKTIFLLALLSHVLTLCFLQFIERPHMQKLYRNNVRDQSGVSRSIHRSLPAPLQKWSGRVDRALDGGLDFVEEFIDAAGPKLAAGISAVVADSKQLFKQFPTRISIMRLSPETAGFDPQDYKLEIDTTRPGVTLGERAHSGREGEIAQKPQERQDDFERITIDYGAPIRIKWAAPANHSKKDWIGLYRVGDNASHETTKVGSQGRWTATTPGNFDYNGADLGILVSDQAIEQSASDRNAMASVTGEIEFSGDKLWWTQGVFEFRYHHDGKYAVMATSRPFEIRISRFDEDDVEVDAQGQIVTAVEQVLLPVVQDCFDRDPDVAPRNVDEPFGDSLERDGKFAKRVVYAVQQMFGIEFAPEVVRADGNVKRLAWRICSAKKVLAPYSMSHSKGRNTPT